MRVQIRKGLIFQILILLIALTINRVLCDARKKSSYTEIDQSDFKYLTRSGIEDVKRPIDILLHFSRTKTPKYTILLFNVFAGIKVVSKVSTSMYVHLMRHLDHYDRSFSDNAQFIVPNIYPNVNVIKSILGSKGVSALQSGTIPEEPYIELIVAVIALVNSLVRKGIIPSYQHTAFYGNCVGGLIGSAASVALKEPISVVVLNGSSMFMTEVVRKRLAKKKSLVGLKFLIIHSHEDQLIPFLHAENTHNTLSSWGVDSKLLVVERLGHVNTMIKHKYTGFRFIASTMLSRPEIYRPQDTDDAELINRTKKKINPEDIEPIVPPRDGVNGTFSEDPSVNATTEIQITTMPTATYILQSNG
ncbi:Alpha/Beta hydrolase fold containing protein [Cryptosporidium felis]|nr:Alpha/Beta hydrolase fold containing protein [Cryptosporidium felis]